jgi:hypothetical protein
LKDGRQQISEAVTPKKVKEIDNIKIVNRQSRTHERVNKRNKQYNSYFSTSLKLLKLR